MAELLGPLGTLFVQLGSRQIQYNFTDVQKQLFKVPFVQIFIMFFVFFGSTKRISIAVILTIAYYLALFVLLNDKHPLNILPRFWLRKEGFLEEETREKGNSYDRYKDNMQSIYA